MDWRCSCGETCSRRDERCTRCGLGRVLDVPGRRVPPPGRAGRAKPHWVVWLAIPALFAVYSGLYFMRELYVNAAAFLHTR